MKKEIYFLLLALALVCFSSCDNERNSVYSYDDPTIFSTSNKVLLSEVILFISPYIKDGDQKKYLVTDNLCNLSLKVNKRTWQQKESHKIDSLHLSQKETLGNYRVTNEKIQYPFAVNVRISSEGFSTAGEYSDLLNNYLNLQPGNYICQVESFDVKQKDGSLQTVYTPSLTCVFEVKDNYASATVGEFEVFVNQ